MIHLRPGSRARPTLRQYLSPLWWATDAEMDAGWTRWGWFLRNPFCNFGSTIIGVAHLPRLTATTEPQGRTYPVSGINVGLTLAFRCGYVPVCLPMLAWRMLGWEGCTGWKMNGTWTLCAFRRANSKNATESPKS